MNKEQKTRKKQKQTKNLMEEDYVEREKLTAFFTTKQMQKINAIKEKLGLNEFSDLLGISLKFVEFFADLESKKYTVLMLPAEGTKTLKQSDVASALVFIQDKNRIVDLTQALTDMVLVTKFTKQYNGFGLPCEPFEA